MPERAAQVNYQGFDPESSRLTTPETRTDNDYLNVRAQPQTEVGGALEKLGQTEEKTGGDVTNFAIQQQGRINETLQTDAEIKYATDLGALKNKYQSHEGLAASAALPQFTNDVQALQQKYRAGLPEGAARGFDVLAGRHTVNAITDANTYASTQIKKADIDSAVAQTSFAATQAGTLAVAADDHRFAQTIGDIHFGIARQMQAHGWDAGTGMQQNQDGSLSFDEGSDQGKQAKAVYQDSLAKATGTAWENRLHVLADQNVNDSYGIYKLNRDQIPGEAQVKLDAYFTPRVRDYQAKSTAENVLNTATQDYTTALKAGAMSNLPGDNKNATAPVDFIMQHEGGYVSNDSGKGPTNFGINQEANRDIDVKNLTQDQAKDLIQARYLQPIGADKMSPAMAMVAGDSAVNMGVGKTKELLAQAGDDPQKMIDLRRAEYQRLAQVNPDKYGPALQGWMSRLDDLQTSLPQAGTQRPQAPLVTSQADYYRANYQKIVDKAVTQAQQDHPDDPVYEQSVRARVEQRMSDAIKQQDVSHKADDDLVFQAFTGALSQDGKRPTSVDEMLSTNPSVKSAWDRMQINNPLAAQNIETKILTGNATSKDTKEYGSGYWDAFKGVTNGKITDITQIYDRMGPNGDISTAGMKQLQEVLKGDKDTNALRAQTFKTVRSMFLGKADSFGVPDPDGEAEFGRAMRLMDDSEKTAEQNKVSRADMYDPTSKDWIGNVAKPLAKTMEQRLQAISAKVGQGGGSSGQLPEGVPPVEKREAGKTTAMVGGKQYIWNADGKWYPAPQVPMEK